MPYVNIQITTGATREQKSKIVEDVTVSLQKNLGKLPEHVHIVIQEIEEENWGFAGMLTDDWKKEQKHNNYEERDSFPCSETIAQDKR